MRKLYQPYLFVWKYFCDADSSEFCISSKLNTYSDFIQRIVIQYPDWNALFIYFFSFSSLTDEKNVDCN